MTKALLIFFVVSISMKEFNSQCSTKLYFKFNKYVNLMSSAGPCKEIQSIFLERKENLGKQEFPEVSRIGLWNLIL